LKQQLTGTQENHDILLDEKDEKKDKDKDKETDKPKEDNKDDASDFEKNHPHAWPTIGKK